MSATGYIQVHAYTSQARIPLENVAVTVTDPSGSAIAMRLTNRSGILDIPIAIQTPNLADSQSPNTGIVPYTTVNIQARLENYEEIDAMNVQIFADTVTDQDLPLIPLSELPEYWNQAEIFQTPPQNL